MKHKLTGILNVLGVLIFLAWAPGALAASWSSTVCKVPPTYGPYCCTKYYCPAVGSFEPTTVFTGQIGSDITKCTDTTTDNCVQVVDTIELQTDPSGIPNQLIQCGVPGGYTCNNPKKCGDSGSSSGIVFLNQNYTASLKADLTSTECTKDGRDKQYKCSKLQHFGGLEGNDAAAALYCPNAQWRVLKWLALRLIARNWAVYSSDPTTPQYRTDFSCVLVDENGLRPGEQGYAPNLSDLSKNSYDCEELPVQ